MLLELLKLVPLAFGVASTSQVTDSADAEIAWIAEGGFCEPETVLPLPDDTLLVSNVCDFAQPGNGFLSLLDEDGNAIEWRALEGLDAPLGMALHSNRLHVIDNNQVKVFRWPGFEPVTTVALETVVANDIAVGPDQTMYVTDSARGEVVVISPDLRQSVLTGQPQFPGANGIHINDTDLWVGGGRLWHVDLDDLTVTTVGPAWVGGIDGIEQESDGSIQVSPVAGPLIRLAANADSDIHVLGAARSSSANHGYAENLGLALIPTGFENTVIAIRVRDL